MGVKAEFNIWSLPEYDNHVEQPDKRLSIIAVGSSIVSLVVPMESPRYVTELQFRPHKLLLITNQGLIY
jgi:hypothetical protein